MTGSRYITTQIVEMLARLQAMQVKLDQGVGNMYVRAVDYLKKEAQQEYEQMKRREAENELTVWPDGQIVHYLYICAIDKLAANHADGQVNDYFIAKLENRSADYSICEKAMIALVMQGAGKSGQASELVQSIKEYLVGTEEMGLYFDTPKAAYSWRSYKIPAQVAAMEAIYRIAPDTSMLNGMKQWLLKQKQVQVWESSVSTADAVYAFLCMGSDTLGEGGSMEATVGKTTWQTPQDALGYAPLPEPMPRQMTSVSAVPVKDWDGEPFTPNTWRIWTRYCLRKELVCKSNVRFIVTEKPFRAMPSCM